MQFLSSQPQFEQLQNFPTAPILKPLSMHEENIEEMDLEKDCFNLTNIEEATPSPMSEEEEDKTEVQENIRRIIQNDHKRCYYQFNQQNSQMKGQIGASLNCPKRRLRKIMHI